MDGKNISENEDTALQTPQRSSKYEVYLNVYDLHVANDTLYPFGLGVYHTGVEICGKEWSYGGNPEYAGTGVFHQLPRQIQDFRETIYLGTANLTQKQYTDIQLQIFNEFIANEYDMLTKNCNHFSDRFARLLLGVGIPLWCNRLAHVGKICGCCINSKLDPLGTDFEEGGYIANDEMDNETQGLLDNMENIEPDPREATLSKIKNVEPDPRESSNPSLNGLDKEQLEMRLLESEKELEDSKEKLYEMEALINSMDDPTDQAQESRI